MRLYFGWTPRRRLRAPLNDSQACQLASTCGCTDAAVALEEFQAKPGNFDVAVTDLPMLKMSGFALARELQAIRPDVPIVLTSGYVRPEDQEKALGMGLRDLILKPSTIEQLGRTVDQLFRAESSVSK